MTTVSWQLKLGVDGVDEVNKANKALRDTKKAADETNKAVGAVRDAKGRFLPRGSQGAGGGGGGGGGGGVGTFGIPSEFLAQPAKLGVFAKALQAVGSGVSKLFGAKAGGAAVRGILGMAEGLSKIAPMLPAVGAVAGAAVTVFAAASGAALAGARAVVQAQAFREDSMGALRTLLRSNDLADQAFRTAVKTADFLGRGRQETVGQFVDLLAKGFDIKKVDEIVKSMADLATVDPKANMDAIVRAIGQIKGTGRLQGDELLQLADAGLETSAVYEQLAKILKKSVPDVQKQISAGKVDADTAIQAILAAINSQAGGGAAGAAAAKKSVESISGLLRRLENLPENLLFSLDVAPGMERVRAFLKELVGFFDMNSSSAKEFNAVLSDVFNEFIAGLLGEDPAATLKDSFKSLTATIKEMNAQGTTRQFGEMVATMGKLAVAIGTVTAALGTLEVGMGAGVGVGGEFLGISNQILSTGFLISSALSPAFTILNDLASIDFKGLAVSFGELVNSLPAAIEGLIASASQAGADIVAGLANGITSNGQAVIDALTGVVGGAITWAKQLLGIASPSKVFAQLGDFTAEGFAVGVAGNDNAQGAIADMTAPPDGAGPALRLGGRGGPLIGGDLNIRVDGRGQDDERLARLIAAEVTRALENIALQVGAVTPDTEAA